MEAWIGMGRVMGKEKEPGIEDLPEGLWAPHTAPHSSARAPLALSRLLFFILDDTSAWNVPPSSSDETHSHHPA